MGKVTKVIIEIDTTNDDFEHDFEYAVASALFQVKVIDGYKLQDSNGNTIGEVTVETE